MYTFCDFLFFSVQVDEDVQDLIKKFSEHYHDAWASRKLESGWSYGETWSGEEKLHPRLKPFNMLSDYVSVASKVKVGRLEEKYS